MNNRFNIVLVVLALAGPVACNRKQLQLDPVRYVPDYFHNSEVYGENEKEMEEKNTFLLETGYIDTTSELPPLSVAYISIHQKTIQLNRIKTRGADSLQEEYEGSGYRLLFLNKDKIRVTKGALMSEYTLRAQQGYR